VHFNVGSTRATSRNDCIAWQHVRHRLHHPFVDAGSWHCPGSIRDALLNAEMAWGWLSRIPPGITSLLSKASSIAVPDASMPQVSAHALFGHGILVGASNPKALLFFVSLFPQFIEPSAPQAAQFAILGVTFIFFELFWC